LDAEKDNKTNFKNYIDTELSCVKVFPVSLLPAAKENEDSEESEGDIKSGNPDNKGELYLEKNYSEKSELIANYLQTLKRSFPLSKLIIKKWKTWKNNALRFIMHEKNFFRKVNKNIFLRRIVNSVEE
jgi:hypothetical protein